MRIRSLLLALLLILSLCLSLASCNDDPAPDGGNEPIPDGAGEGLTDGAPDGFTGDTVPEEDIIYIAIKGRGIITVALYAEQAPITVANFKRLASEGFYDGLTFHRVIESFMIQGGCPLGNGTGDSGTDITGEFANNGYDTGIKHVEGTISMARSGHPYEAYHNAGYVTIPFEQRAPYYNSASSQFFIVTETSESNSRSLDGNYAAFGRVLKGMDIVKAIAAVETGANDKPVKTVTIATITADKAAAEAALGIR